MKKTKLNLLVNRENYQKIEKIFSFIRILFYIQLSFLAVLFLFFFISTLRQNNAINGLLEQKKTLLQALQTKKDDEAKLIYLQDKYSTIKNFLKDDARSLPYYDLLNSSLSSSTGSAGLKSFLISKNREVEFSVAFINFNDLLSFFRFIESDSFLKNFEQVSLKSFSAIENSASKQNYELAFVGKFIEIK